MWPKYLDLADEECAGILRRLELLAYSGVVTALRAQGQLTKERRKTLQDLSVALNISIERHKAEVRRAVNDEVLNTVAASICGAESDMEWAREGRRIIPLLRRADPITMFTATVDAAKAQIEDHNRQLLPPIRTQTPLKACKSVDGNAALKSKNYSLHTSPPTLEDIVVKTKDVEGKNRLYVTPPSFSLPKAPLPYKAHNQDYFGGDVVVLPSGMAIRVMSGAKSSEENDENTPGSKKNQRNRRKRKIPSESDTGADSKQQDSENTKFEILRHPLKFPQHPHPQQHVYQFHSQRMPPPLPPNFQLGLAQQPVFAPMPPPAQGPIRAIKASSVNQGNLAPLTKNRRPSTAKVRKVKSSEKVPRNSLQQRAEGQQIGIAGPPKLALQQNSSQFIAAIPVSSSGHVNMMPAQLKDMPAKSGNGEKMVPTSAAQTVIKHALITTRSDTAMNETEDLPKSTLPNAAVSSFRSQAQQSHVIRHQPGPYNSHHSIQTTIVQPESLPVSPIDSAAVVTVSENGITKNITVSSAGQVGTLTVCSNGSLVPSPNMPGNQASIKSTPFKLKEPFPANGTMATSIVTTSSVAATMPAGGMKVIPTGARILPKPGSVSMGSSAAPGTPIYMVSTNPGQNLVRVSKTIPPTGSNTAIVGTSATQRIVTLSAAALRPPGIVTLPGTNPVGSGVTTFRPGVQGHQVVRGLQPRCLTAASPGTTRAIASSKPSVIVVQRGHHGHGNPRSTTGKDAATGHRIIATSKTSLTGSGKPVVIATKPTATPLATTSSIANASAAAKASSGQGNVIVLDLSQESFSGNNMLSDILQATGIFPEEGPSSAPSQSTSRTSGNNDRLQKHRKADAYKSVNKLPASTEHICSSKQQIHESQTVVTTRKVHEHQRPPIELVAAAFKNANVDHSQMTVENVTSKVDRLPSNAIFSSSKVASQNVRTTLVAGSSVVEGVANVVSNAQDVLLSNGGSFEDRSTTTLVASRGQGRSLMIGDRDGRSRIIGEVGDEIVGDDGEPPPTIGQRC